MKDLPSQAGETIDHRRHLERLSEIGIALSSERSLNRLLKMILSEARSFTNAEAGTLYVTEKNELIFAVVQNDRVPVQKVPHTRIPIERSSLAGYVAATGRMLNLADVSALPQSAEYRFDDSFDRHSGYTTRSMLVMPLVAPTSAVNGVIQLINALDPATAEVVAFDPQIEGMCRSLASQAGVALHNTQLTEELEHAYQETVFRLAKAAEYRDADTGQHIKRVAHYSRELALAVGLSDQEAHILMLASPMHDIGKVAVPDSILKKAGPLTSGERRVMNRHTVFGAEILSDSPIPLLMLSQIIALTHHERWDGTGYPGGMKGEQIPLAGRIIAVVDVFDALTSPRCYKDAISVDKACEFLRENAGSQFDPALVDAFLDILPRIHSIRERFPD